MRYGSRADEIHAQVVAMLDGLEPQERNAVYMRLFSAAGVRVPLGECRLHERGDYPAVRPVLKRDGLHWCCMGDPEHCSRVVRLEGWWNLR